MEKTTAIYLRSSKDRSDISIDAQRRELTTVAADRGLLILEEYSDVVESAKDENRPAFQQMLRDLRSTSRTWGALLLVDTSRLSRNIYVAEVFKHECRKRNVKIIYSKIPEANPIMDMVIVQILQAFDQMHSMMSKEKGLAGMAENVRQGFRAGGRAPKGYKLSYVTTGAVREGQPVRKSILMPSEDAPIIARYLQGRAKGRKPATLIRELGLSISSSSLVGMEWNALTYAGHTVWNVRNEFDNGYKGGTKRRPRAEWVIQKNTHPRLILDEEAEAILSQLESNKRTRASQSLLTGLLYTPDGEAWHANAQYYRPRKGLKGRWIKSDEIEAAIIEKVKSDLSSDIFIRSLMDDAKAKSLLVGPNPADAIRSQVSEINRQISKAMDVSLALSDPGPALRKIDELEAKRKTLAGEISRIEQERAGIAAFKHITENDVRTIIAEFADDLMNMEPMRRKDSLSSLIERIELDPKTLTCQIHYKVPCRDKMASPKESHAIPSLETISYVRAFGGR